MSILPLQVTSNVQTSLSIFLLSEELNEPPSIDLETSKVGSYLVLQLKSFVNNYNFIKYIKKVQCTENPSVPVVADDVSFHK